MSGRDEEKPLLSKFDTKQRNQVEDLEDVGGGSEGNPNFAPALQLSVRTGVWMCILGAIIWVPAIRKPFPNQIQGMVPLLICLFVFSVNPFVGRALGNAIAGINGTYWAVFHMWVMNGIFPGGMKEGMSPTSSVAIFGWANFLIGLWVALMCKCGLGTKMFYLATFIGFSLGYLNPASNLGFSENFTISMKGTGVNTMIATCLGTLSAPVMNLLPYPMSFAYTTMKDNAVKASSDTGKLFTFIIDYYCGSEGSVVIESCVKHAADLRTQLDGLGEPLGAAWYEGLDMGTRGLVRALMESHSTLMNDVYDRMKAILVVVRSEDFGPSHTAIMGKITDATMRVALATKKLLIAVTEAATDGDISSKEKAELQSLILESKAAIKQLAKDFDAARKAYGKSVSTDLLGENYFVLTVSGYARLVVDYTEMMMSNPPKPTGLGTHMVNWLTSTWDFSAMTERFNMAFTLVHFIAIVFCWCYSVYVDGFGGGCVITSVFLMSTAVCPDVQGFLNVLSAVMVAVIMGTLVYQWTCGTGSGDYILPFVALFLWIIGLYGYFSKSVFLLPCLLFVALTPFRWVTSCPTGDIAAGARAIWGGMVAAILAMLFVSSFQYLLAADRAENLAVNSMDDAFSGLRKAFDAFFNHKDATEPMGGVGGAVGDGSGYAGSAAIEPRFWRNSWKKSLYLDIAGHVSQLRLDILNMWFACAGSDGVPDGIFKTMEGSPDFKGVKDDMSGTLEDAHSLAIGMLTHTTGKFTGLSKIKTTTGIDDLDALPGLIDYLNKNLKFPAEPADNLEDDELCQISTVCFLLDCTVKHMAALIKCCIKQA